MSKRFKQQGGTEKRVTEFNTSYKPSRDGDVEGECLRVIGAQRIE